jgi:3'-phosphoadenosine 5'-phosphosulfate sulfotransferase (PAPS reductase)/FAD synthetase
MQKDNRGKSMNKPLPKDLLSAVALPRPLLTAPDVDAALATDAVVVIGISGGKDSQASAYAVIRYLDEIGHKGERLLVHADLGVMEWAVSQSECERLAANLGLELLTVRRKKGDLYDRICQRWRDNGLRYGSLECVRLVLPWPTPGMRYCTSECKASPIGMALTKMFPGRTIVSVIGLRRDESLSKISGRAIAPVSMVDIRLCARKCTGISWRPILDWTREDVFGYIAALGDTPHPAYTEFGSTRVSCPFCIMGSINDLMAAATCESNRSIYCKLVDMEIKSTFAFQGSRWLADVAPHLLDEATRQAIPEAKARAKRRKDAEARLPEHLLYTKGWPTGLPTMAEAALLAEVRREVAEAVGIEIRFVTAEDILQRYKEMMAAKPGA